MWNNDSLFPIPVSRSVILVQARGEVLAIGQMHLKEAHHIRLEDGSNI